MSKVHVGCFKDKWLIACVLWNSGSHLYVIIGFMTNHQTTAGMDAVISYGTLLKEPLLLWDSKSPPQGSPSLFHASSPSYPFNTVQMMHLSETCPDRSARTDLLLHLHGRSSGGKRKVGEANYLLLTIKVSSHIPTDPLSLLTACSWSPFQELSHQLKLL